MDTQEVCQAVVVLMADDTQQTLRKVLLVVVAVSDYCLSKCHSTRLEVRLESEYEPLPACTAAQKVHTVAV